MLRDIRIQGETKPLYFDLEAGRWWLWSQPTICLERIDESALENNDVLHRSSAGEYFDIRKAIDPSSYSDYGDSHELLGRRLDQEGAAEWFVNKKATLPPDLIPAIAHRFVSGIPDYLIAPPAFSLRFEGTWVFHGHLSVDFKRKHRPLELVKRLHASPTGKMRHALHEEMYGAEANANALDKLKSDAEELMLEIGVTIEADGSGLWQLKPI